MLNDSGRRRSLRGAIIGCGYFSRFHFDAWNRIDDVNIIACCDANLRAAEDASHTFQVPGVYGDYQQMLDNESLDFVDIVTRPDTHLELVRAAAERGLAIICQKPLAPNNADILEMHRVVDDAGVRFMVHENFRFQPWYREIDRLLRSGVIGETLHTLAFRNRAGDGHGDDAYLDRQPYFREMPRLLIHETGIHTIDTFRFLGGEIRRVWCTHRRLNPVIAGEDSAMAVMEFSDGGMGVYDANRFNESDCQDPRYTFGTLLVECDGGSIRLDLEGNLSIQPLGEESRPHAYEHRRVGFAGDCVHACQQHFADALRNQAPFETNLDSYLRSLAVESAMYGSAQSGAWVQCGTTLSATGS